MDLSNYSKFFALGAIVGCLLIVTVTGANATEQVKATAQNIGKFGLALGFLISLIGAFKRGSVINPKTDGFLAGLGFVSYAYSLILYGFSFP